MTSQESIVGELQEFRDLLTEARSLVRELRELREQRQKILADIAIAAEKASHPIVYANYVGTPATPGLLPMLPVPDGTKIEFATGAGER